MITDGATSPPARVVTIVLNHRHVDDIVRCVRSLQKSDFSDQGMVVLGASADFGVGYLDATVDDLVGQHGQKVRGWRTGIEQEAPDLLEPYDDLIGIALKDAKAGRSGRLTESESVHSSPDPMAGPGEVRRLRAMLERDGRAVSRLARPAATTRALLARRSK